MHDPGSALLPVRRYSWRMRHRLYLHISWTTRDREPTLTARFLDFLDEFLPIIARQERVSILAFGAVRSHLHLIVRVDPSTSLPRLLQRWKGGSSTIGQRDGHSGDTAVRWAKGYNVETVSPRALGDATKYVLRQAERHPAEAIFREAAGSPGGDLVRNVEDGLALTISRL